MKRGRIASCQPPSRYRFSSSSRSPQARTRAVGFRIFPRWRRPPGLYAYHHDTRVITARPLLRRFLARTEYPRPNYHGLDYKDGMWQKSLRRKRKPT